MLPSPPSAFALLRSPRNLASQFELATQTALPDHPTVVDLPQAVWRNNRYVLEEPLSRKGSKGRKSWIKHHGFFLVEIDTNDSPLSPYWVCHLCDEGSHRIFESSQGADIDPSIDETERPKRRRIDFVPSLPAQEGPGMGPIPLPEKPAVIEERNGEIEFRVVNNDDDRESLIVLGGLKCVFQKQLPEMPKSYIARLVYDRAHMSIAIVRKPLAVVGGITYRPFKYRKFAEIAFCAVLSDEQAKGYGAHLMSHLKDYIKASSNMMYLLTYANNLAIPYFKKQSFTKEITLDDSIWKGCIKDYEGGTLMQCSMLPRIRYLEVGRMLLKQKKCVHAKIQTFSKSHVVH
ncbi:hypothetical protein V3481_018867 [Fusarium oxysporum f. sp. vasinfectum]